MGYVEDGNRHKLTHAGGGYSKALSSYRVSSQLLKYENSEYHLIASDIVQTGQKEHKNETSFSHPTGFTQYTSIGAQMVASNRLTIRTGIGSQMKVYTFIVENKI